MNPHMNPKEELLTFEATVKIRIKASNKMEAANKFRTAVISSAVAIRDYIIEDFSVVGD